MWIIPTFSFIKKVNLGPFFFFLSSPPSHMLENTVFSVRSSLCTVYHPRTYIWKHFYIHRKQQLSSTVTLQTRIPVSYNNQGCYLYYRVCLWKDVPCVNFCTKYPVPFNHAQGSPRLCLNSAVQVYNHTRRTWAPTCRSASFAQFQSPLFYLHTHLYMLIEVLVIVCKNVISFRKGAQEIQLSYKWITSSDKTRKQRKI